MSNLLYLIGSLLLGGAAVKSGNGILMGAAIAFLLGTMLKFKEYPDVIERTVERPAQDDPAK